MIPRWRFHWAFFRSFPLQKPPNDPEWIRSGLVPEMVAFQRYFLTGHGVKDGEDGPGGGEKVNNSFRWDSSMDMGVVGPR